MLSSMLYSVKYIQRKGHNISNFLSKAKERERKGGRTKQMLGERKRSGGGTNLGEEYMRIFVQFLQLSIHLNDVKIFFKKVNIIHLTSYMVESKMWRKDKSVTLELWEVGNREWSVPVRNYDSGMTETFSTTWTYEICREENTRKGQQQGMQSGSMTCKTFLQ